MNVNLAFAIKRCIRGILRLMRVFPVKHNRVVFISYEGQRYACNPKYVSEYLQCAYPGEWEIIWVLDHPEQYPELKEQGIRVVKNDSPAFMKAVMTAGAIVSNNGLAMYFPPLRKNQCMVNTWHGGGAYKRVLSDWKKDPMEKKLNALMAEQTRWFISSSKRFSAIMAEAASLSPEKMKEWGMPRNDILFDPPQQVIRKVRHTYGVSDDCRIVLYAPTYRGGTTTSVEAATQMEPLHVETCLVSLKKRFGGEWIFFYRDHYFNQQHHEPQASVIDVSDYDDMQELLCTADILITDYSSSIWDYSFTRRPCFLYAPDRQQYQSERDFYTPIERWPALLAQSNGELAELIELFDEQDYARRIQEHHEELESCENGYAAKTLGDKLYKECFGK